MANRTVQIHGQGFGANPAEITVTANGNTIFSGTINTLDVPPPALPNLELGTGGVLCTFEVDMAFAGQIPMTCAVTSGTVIFSQIWANYTTVTNPVYTPQQIQTLNDPATTQAEKVGIWTSVANPAFSQQDIDTLMDPQSTPQQVNTILSQHNCLTYISSGANLYTGVNGENDPRTSVSINGVLQTPDHGELPGTWWWTINSGSTMTYQLIVDAGNP